MKERLATARSAKQDLSAEMGDLETRAKKIASQHLSGAISREEANKQLEEIQVRPLPRFASPHLTPSPCICHGFSAVTSRHLFSFSRN